MRIGVIENAPDRSLALRDMITSLGYELGFVEVSLEQVSKQISKTRPEILIVALRLVASPESLHCIRQLQRDYNLSIVYLGTPAEEALLQAIPPEEISGYLLIPFSEKQFQLSLQLAFQQRLTWELKTTQQQLRQSEIALSQSKNLIQAVWEVAADAMVLSDAEGTVLMANPAYYRLYGLNPEQVIGQNFAIILPEEQREWGNQLYKETFEAEEIPPIFETQILRPDGVELFLETKATFLVEAQRRVAMLSVIRDITDRKQANDQLQQRVEALSTLNFVSRTLATVTDLQKALEIVVKTMTELFEAFGTGIGLLSSGQSVLTVIVDYMLNRPHSELIGLTLQVDSAPIIAQIVRNPQTLVLSPSPLSPSSPLIEDIMQTYNLQAIIVVPLRSRGEVIGVIGVSTDQPGRRFTPTEVTLAETLAGQVAGAIEVARLFEEERRQRRVAEGLRQVTTVLKGNLNDNQLLEAILEHLRPIIRHDSGGVLLQKGDRLVLAGGLSPSIKAHLGEAIPLTSQTPAVRVFKARQLLLINDGAQEPHWLNFPDGKIIQSWIGAPMMVDHEAIGVLTISSYEPGNYSEEDAQTLQSFANQAALALHNARLFEARRQSEALLSETQKIARMGGWELNLETQRLTWTEEVYHLHELPLDYQPSRETILAFCVPEYLPQLEEAVWRSIQQGETFDMELQLMTAKGRRRWVRTMGKVQLENGKPARLFGMLQDITERKRLEEQLLQSQKMEAVGQLAGGVAHHFNNMLMVISGYLEMALEALPPDQPVVADLRLVQRTAERAANLTNQLLTFTRRQMIRPEIINLNDWIHRTQLMLRQVINETIEFKLLLTPDLKSVSMDAHQFEQLLVNLVVNARDAMPEGGQLTLETTNFTLTPAEAGSFPSLAPGEYVRLAVSDTGVGMSQEVKTHLFEPFFTTKPVGQGTGLGLPTCLGIVQQHGGDIVVESELGQGTTFKIYLPCREQPVSPDKKEPRLLPQGSEVILLVEDEAQVRELIARVLRQQGYTVIESTNGEEALQLLAMAPEIRPQLLLTDVVMPRLGGKALLARLKPLYPELKVLFISGYTNEMAGLQEDDLAWQASFLLKPFTPTKLAQSVRAALDANKA